MNAELVVQLTFAALAIVDAQLAVQLTFAVLTIMGAGVSVYVGVKVALAEIRSDIDHQAERIASTEQRLTRLEEGYFRSRT